MLTQAEKSQRRLGVSVRLVGLNITVLNLIQRSPLGSTLDSEGLFFNLEMAVTSSQDSHGKEDARRR
jgi:hypothetical protein